jgi:hypothetical protein
MAEWWSEHPHTRWGETPELDLADFEDPVEHPHTRWGEIASATRVTSFQRASHAGTPPYKMGRDCGGSVHRVERREHPHTRWGKITRVDGGMRQSRRGHPHTRWGEIASGHRPGDSIPAQYRNTPIRDGERLRVPATGDVINATHGNTPIQDGERLRGVPVDADHLLESVGTPPYKRGEIARSPGLRCRAGCAGNTPIQDGERLRGGRRR